MWENLRFEEKMKDMLIADLGSINGEAYFNQYITARNILISDNIWANIQGAERNLTDHSERHIRNVLENADKLLGNDINKLPGINLYCLGLIILFHDVGNIRGRDMHNKNIADVYNYVRRGTTKYNRERTLVIKAGEAHCGRTKGGSKDTLQDVDEVDNLEGKEIKLRTLAAILRLADELAEGKQRTSEYMQTRGLYKKESEIYHKYASITSIFIDRKNERISITYDIDIDDSIKKDDFKKLIEFTFHRIIKLDEERRYNKHYCELLSSFKMTTIQYNFNYEGIPVNLDFEQIRLKDRFPIPGENSQSLESFIEAYSQLEPESLFKRINEKGKNNNYESQKSV